MNKIEKNKSALVWLSLGVVVLSAMVLIGGILLVVFGGKGLSNSGSHAWAIVELVLGIILILAGLSGVGFGIIFLWTGRTLKATNGSIAEDNLAKGTVNMKKCTICGNEINGDEQFCSQCGNRIDGKIVCKNCDNLCDQGSKCCPKCGKDL